MSDPTQPTNPVPSERFQRILAFSSDEADGLGHGYITCQHILYALSREPRGLAGSVLDEFGLTAQKLHDMLAKTSASHDRTLASPMDLSDEARDAVKRAVNIARRWEHPTLDTEHLLFGIVSAPTSADEMLAAFHTHPNALLTRLMELQQSAPSVAIRDEATYAYRLTLESAWLLSHAMDEARRDGATQITSFHLLIAMIAMPGPLHDLFATSLGLSDNALMRSTQPGLSGATARRLPLASDLQKILGCAIGEAWNRGHLAVTPLHLAMGMIRAEQSDALDMLAEQGISRSGFEEAIETAMPPAVAR